MGEFRAGFLPGFERGRILKELPLPSPESFKVDYTRTGACRCYCRDSSCTWGGFG